MEAKIGQQITVLEDFEIVTDISKSVISVKKGDVGYVDANGFIHYITGNARGKIHLLKDLTIKGYDTDNIAKMITKGLDRTYCISDILEEEDIELDSFKREIEAILSEIL